MLAQYQSWDRLMVLSVGSVSLDTASKVCSGRVEWAPYIGRRTLRCPAATR